jgi:hypothetical protein
VLILGLRDTIARDVAAWSPEKRAVDNLCEFLGSHTTIGAPVDAGNYGTLYDLTFTLDNMGAEQARQVVVVFSNEVACAFRGVISMDGNDVSAVRDSKSAGGFLGTVTLGKVTVPADKTRNVTIQMLAPGQIAAGQSLWFRQG